MTRQALKWEWKEEAKQTVPLIQKSSLTSSQFREHHWCMMVNPAICLFVHILLWLPAQLKPMCKNGNYTLHVIMLNDSTTEWNLEAIKTAVELGLTKLHRELQMEGMVISYYCHCLLTQHNLYLPIFISFHSLFINKLSRIYHHTYITNQ